MDSNRAEYSFATLALAFVIGGLIGAGLGFFFVPRTGRETREKIKERGGKSGKKLRDAVETIREKTKGLAEAGKEKFSKVKINFCEPYYRARKWWVEHFGCA
jgi:hypothetical protein